MDLSATAVGEQPRLTPQERLEALCDPGSVQVLRSRAVSPKLGPRAAPGDGVVGATGSVGGRPIACYAQDGAYLGGSLGERHADTIVRVLQTAGRARIPVVGFVSSGGARMQEGTAALAGYGRIFRNTVALTGVVPQISVVSGASAGGGAYSPALTDLIVMTGDAAMFLTGPGVVREALGEQIDAAALGGPRVHDRNGVCHLVEADEAAAAARVRDLLGYLPSAAGEPLPRALPVDPEIADPGDLVPREPRRIYDVRDALRGIVDAGSLVELWPRWARNVVVRAFAAARVPKLTVVLRKSYGGAHITMNSRDLGADLVLAWPEAQLGIMSARAAVAITHRRELGLAGDRAAEHARLADAYAQEHLGADAAAAAGFVDEIVEPAGTRERLAWALAALAGGRP